MTVNEFKAWLEGFSEAMGSSPNIKQWKKIQDRLGSVSDSGCHHCTHWWPTWYSPSLTITNPVSTEPFWTVTNYKSGTDGGGYNGNDITITAANEIGKAEAVYLATA